MEQATAADLRLAELEQAFANINFTSLALKSLDETIFERALQTIGEEFADQPLVRARLLETVASTWRDLGLLERALAPQSEAPSLWRQELGDEHPDTIASLRGLDTLVFSQRLEDDAELFALEALKLARRVLGNDDPTTLRIVRLMGNIKHHQEIFPEAEAYYGEALAGWRRIAGDDDPETLSVHGEIAITLSSQKRYDEAEPHFRTAIEGLSPDISPAHLNGRYAAGVVAPVVPCAVGAHRGRQVGPLSQCDASLVVRSVWVLRASVRVFVTVLPAYGEPRTRPSTSHSNARHGQPSAM